MNPGISYLPAYWSPSLEIRSYSSTLSTVDVPASSRIRARCFRLPHPSEVLLLLMEPVWEDSEAMTPSFQCQIMALISSGAAGKGRCSLCLCLNARREQV